jgi:ABC-2 type transport system permease protein/lipopolysaccharide transport system permease protein
MNNPVPTVPEGGPGIVIPTSVGRLDRSLAVRDLREALADWRLWGMLGWQDIKQRYRRSTLGPFWLTLSMGAMVGSIGLVYAVIFGQEIHEYLPYVALGFVFWGFISGVMVDGCSAFVSSDAIIKQSRLPLSLHVFRIVWRQSITFAHNFVIFIVVALIFQVWPTFYALLFIPAMAVWVLNAVWVTLVLGLICARYRDIPQIVNSVIQLGFLVTPIIWKAKLMTSRAIFVNANPLHHFIEIVREPLLGGAPAALSWYFVLAVTAAGWIVTFELFRRYRWRIAYWL